MSIRHISNLICCFIIVVIGIHCVRSGTLRFTPHKTQKGTPVILIPGDGGSQLEAKLDKPEVVHFFCSKKTDYWFPIWLNLELITPLTIDCLVDNLRLVYDNVTRTTANAPGVQTRISNFGNTTSVEFLDVSQLSVTSYFNPIVEMFVKNGYVRGESVRAAPFDFRKASNELTDYNTRLKDLIEDTYERNGKKRVCLLAHSMGNVVTLYFLNRMDRAWKDKYIHTFVTVAAPWAGAVKTLKVMASGDDLDVFVVRAYRARLEQRTMPSTTWLMPSDIYWRRDEVLVQTPLKNFTSYDYKAFFDAMAFPTGWLMREDTQNLTGALIAPGVTVHCLHGSEIRTPNKYTYGAGSFPDYQPTETYGDGDGTVNLRSLLAFSKWKTEQKQPVFHKEFPGAEHMAILSNVEVIQYIESLVTASSS